MLEESLRSHTAVTLGDNLVVTLETGDRYGFLVHKVCVSHHSTVNALFFAHFLITTSRTHLQIRPLENSNACSLVGADVSLIIGDIDAEEGDIAEHGDEGSRGFLVDGDASFDEDLHRAIAASLENAGVSSTAASHAESTSGNPLFATSANSLGEFGSAQSFPSGNIASSPDIHTPGIYTADPSISPDMNVDELFEGGMFHAPEVDRVRTPGQYQRGVISNLTSSATGTGVYRPLSQQLSESTSLHTPRTTPQGTEASTRVSSSSSSPAFSPSSSPHFPSALSASSSPSLRPSSGQPPVSLLRTINERNSNRLPPPSPGLASASPALQASRSSGMTPPLLSREPNAASPYLGGSMSPFLQGANENIKLEPNTPVSGLLFENQTAVYTFIFKSSSTLPTLKLSLKSNAVDDVMKCSEMKGYPLPPPPSHQRTPSLNLPNTSPFSPSPLLTPAYTSLPNLSLLSGHRSSLYDSPPTDATPSKERIASDADGKESANQDGGQEKDAGVNIPASADLYISPTITRPTRYYFSVTDNSTSTDKVVSISPKSKHYPRASVTGSHVVYITVYAYGDDIEYTLLAETLLEDSAKAATPDAASADSNPLAYQKSPLSVHSPSLSEDVQSPSLKSGMDSGTGAAAVSIGLDEGVCQTCGVVLPKSRMMMHEAYCARNNFKCPVCKKVMQKAVKDEHNHCPFYPSCTFEASNQAGVQKHRKLAHDPFLCELGCGEEILLENYHDHRKTFCVNRRETCIYCKLQLPHRLLHDHQEKCGSRTVLCPSCNKYIMKKRFTAHEQSNCELTDTPFLAAQSESSASQLTGLRDFVLDRASSPLSATSNADASSSAATPTSSQRVSPSESPRSSTSEAEGGAAVSSIDEIDITETPFQEAARTEPEVTSNVEDTTHRTFTCPTCKLVLPPTSFIDDLQMHVLFQCPKRGRASHTENVRSLFGEAAVSAIDVVSMSDSSEDEVDSPRLPFSSFLGSQDSPSEFFDGPSAHLPERTMRDDFEGRDGFGALSGDDDFEYFYDSEDDNAEIAFDDGDDDGNAAAATRVRSFFQANMIRGTESADAAVADVSLEHIEPVLSPRSDANDDSRL